MPRCLFEALGIDAFQGLSFDERVEFLGNVLKGTTAAAPQLAASGSRSGREEGRFEEMIGEIDNVEPGPPGCASTSRAARRGPRLARRDRRRRRHGLQQVGAGPAAAAAPVEHYKVPVEDGRIRLRTNCGVPGLDRADSRLCMMGLNANTVIPHGDTIAGLKYIGRRFVADCARAEKLRRAAVPRPAGDAALARARDGEGDAPASAGRSSSPRRPTMCPTVLGRIQTRAVILIGPGDARR